MSVPDVFIIESLHPEDEGNGRFEGGSIAHLLRLHGKSPIYRYVRSDAAFREAVKEFKDSDYRYLHISAHGDEEGMCTTNNDDINYAKLAKIFKDKMVGKRLFLSACSMVRKEMAREFIPTSGCNSIIGPADEISFEEAVVIWPLVYHLLFQADSEKIQRRNLVSALKSIKTILEGDVAYFTASKQAKGGYREVSIG